jgi:hypothetical protein
VLLLGACFFSLEGWIYGTAKVRFYSELVPKVKPSADQGINLLDLYSA